MLAPGNGRGETLPPSLEGLGEALVGPADGAGAGGLGLHLLGEALHKKPPVLQGPDKQRDAQRVCTILTEALWLI